ncbi:hypothetical protein H6F74_26880 [Trichocoleus sp. FACHB-90]|uniref:hypothetical protein n=1 Tax=Cyanophyceae TaxID=3028117 RepID=UPI0016835270|nr:hypothetical protein [Trichocoleus sp. FACHB-90]MBD1929831.1 hypothetical protein [Trichocoleus sp. FACHB-90]
MDYLIWNDLIASHFFRPEMAGRTVYLYVTEKLIAELGQGSSADFQDFIKAVKIGLFERRGKGICQKALDSMEHWTYRCRRRGYPLYIGYLALFVLAAGREGEFSANAYYPRLRKLLGEDPTSGQYRYFDQMRKLWDDLERWSNEDKSGELGIFKSDIAGSWIHVGRPLAQTFLTEEERHTLPVIFATAGLDPTSAPSGRVLALLLARYGHQQLRSRTLRLLEESSNSDKPLRDALLERIVDELRDWDGTAAPMPSGPNTQVYGALRLCCQLNRIAGRANMTLRCSTKQEFPEDGLSLVLDGYSGSFRCEEYVMGWSEPIRCTDLACQACIGGQINASHFDWSEGLCLQSPDQRWCFRLPQSLIRIFIDGAGFGLPGLVEVRQLPSASRFYLAARQDCCQLLEKWGESSCKGFEKLPIIAGLPHGWHFFHVAAAYSDDLVKYEYPILSLPTTVRFDLEGGIRISRGNQFFKFAPPKLVLTGGNDSIRVCCNSTPLDCSQAEGIYELPDHAPTGTKIEIEARIGEDVVRCRSLFLVEDFSWPDRSLEKRFDRFGHRFLELDNSTVGVAGALVFGEKPPPFNFNTWLPVQGKQRIFFVGREPGQVACWPSEPLPTDWTPVWAVATGRRRQAMFCGISLLESEPRQSKCKDKRKLRQWKEILWHWRKKTSLPIDDRLRPLWNKFQKEAERVKG